MADEIIPEIEFTENETKLLEMSEGNALLPIKIYAKRTGKLLISNWKTPVPFFIADIIHQEP